MKQAIAISRNQLIELIRSLEGATFVAFQALTEVQKSKAKNAVRVMKASNVHATAEWVYENSVNNQLGREENENAGKFQAQPRKWGEHETLSLVWHKGQAYLHVKINKALRSPSYFVNGDPVSKEEIAHLLPVPRQTATQTAVGLKKEVVCRDYKIDSIKEFRVNGERFLIV